MGIDFSAVLGQNIISPVQGKANNSFFEKKDLNDKYIKVPTVVIIPTGQNIGFDKLELLYVGPIGGGWRNVNKGDIVGQSVSLQSLGYPSSVGPHIHLQMKLKGAWVNPTPYFPELS